jgi:hypothetical protein
MEDTKAILITAGVVLVMVIIGLYAKEWIDTAMTPKLRVTA